MPKWAVRTAIWMPLLIAAALLIAYVWVHRPFAVDSTELTQVPLSEADPKFDQVGDLKYLGGLDIPRMGQNVGGLSGLRWDAESGRLLAITDDARWVWITPVEEAGRLTGIAEIEVGDLLGLGGETLTGKQQGDSEALTLSVDGDWLVAYERDHRVWRYDDIAGTPEPSGLDPIEYLGPLDENLGVEALASNSNVTLVCVERPPANRPARTNCLRAAFGTGIADFNAAPPRDMIALGGVPTDADALADGTVLILFRSYSPSDGNRAAIVSYTLGRQRREIATLSPPLTVDNFEGLALREEAGKTFVYIVSDDNFSGNQRTLLMKFEVVVD